jgi:tetratricopeptide (TPR) repeat protein
MQIAHVQGYVFDRDGKPIAGATVAYRNRLKNTVFRTTTNEKGEYFRMGLPADYYDVLLVVNGKEMMEIKNHLIYVSANMGTDVRNHENWNFLDLDLRKKSGDDAPPYAQILVHERPEDLAADAERRKVAEIKSAMTAGEFDLQSGSLETAIARFKEALAVDPGHAAAWGRLGEVYSAQNKHEEAIEAQKKAITLQPGEALHHANLAAAYSATRGVEIAVDEYRRAAELDSKNKAVYLFSAAAVMANAGKRKAAIALFDEVVQADPDYAPARYHKALNQLVIWDSEGRKGPVPPQAISDLQKYLELDPAGEYAEDCREKLAALTPSAKK